MLKLLIVAGLAATTPAAGVAQERLPDVVVSFADIDLASSQGAARFDRRIARAVNDTCPSRSGVRALWRLREIAACQDSQSRRIEPLRIAALARAGMAGKR